MNKKLKQLLLSIVLLGAFSNCLAQGEVNVNNPKGTASVRVPLIKFNINEIKYDVALQYVAQSVKVKRGGGDIGTGWTFDGEGTIERVLKGLPDEKQATSGDSRTGWMAQSNYSKPLNFSIADDNNESTCTDEAINYNAIHNNFGYTNDPEPDWFVVDAPGLKCKLVLDNSNNFKVIPVQDIKVQVTYPNGVDPAFIITNPAGIKYTFVTTSKITRGVSQLNSSLDLFVNDYEYFKTPLTYIKTWHLDKVSRAGNESRSITFSYTQKDPVNSTEYTTVTSLAPNVYPAPINVNEVGTTLVGQKLNSISTSLGQSIEIVRLGESNIISSFNIKEGYLRERKLDFNRVYLNNERSFLESITETAGGCSSKLYKFEYYGCDFATGTSVLPSLTSNKRDAWGNFYDVYESPKIYVYPGLAGNGGIYRPYQIPNYQGEQYLIAGYNPNVIDEESIKAGLISKITYPTGGSSFFEYESNSFWDEDANAEIKGAGARIKTITHFDGISPAKSNLINYFYNVPGQNRTSGSIKSLPQTAFTVNSSYRLPGPSRLSESQILGLCSLQSADYWQYHTLLIDDASTAGKDVQYEYVTVKKNTIGKTEYKYSLASTLWSEDTNSLVYPASACSSAKYPGLPVRKGYNQYPFPPKEEKEYAAGLLVQEKVYTENNTPVKVFDYEYEDYYTTPPIIYGVGFDRVDGNDMFSRYGLHINAKLLKREKETTYDTGLSGNSLVAEAVYENSAQGRQVRTKTVLNSDNSVTQSSFTYTGDFPFQASDVTSDPYAEGIYLLNQNNIKNVVVEQLIKKKDAGTSEFKVYEGQLTLFKKGAANSNPSFSYAPLLSEIKSFNASSGIPNFSEITFNNGFLSYNSSYRTKQKLEDYDEYNLPTLITTNRVKKGIIYDFSSFVPVAEFYGTELKNIVFSGFDGGVLRTFRSENMSSPDFTHDAHTGTSAGILRSNNSFNRDFIKAPGAKFYMISLWVKSTNAATINVLLNNSIVATISSGASDKYVFYQKQVDVSTIPDNSVVKLTSSQDVFVDDAVFCPLGTTYLISTYDYPYGKSAESSSSGKTVFWEYDLKGRPLYTRDGNKNIVQANTYQSYNTTSASLSALFTQVENTFSTSNNCLIGVKYKWDFGDGTILETYDRSVTHILPPGGPHRVKLTATHPDLGTKIYMEDIYMPFKITICAAGVISKDVCGFDPIQYGECSSAYSAPVTGATLYLVSVEGAGGPVSYEWERMDGNGNWIPQLWASNGPLEQPLWLGTYIYRCKVNGPSYRTSYSNPIYLNYYQSQPNCPIPDEN